MSCIDVKVKLMAIPSSVSIETFEGIALKTLLLSKVINSNIKRISLPINVRCGLMCTAEELNYYLNVTPEAHQWITVDIDITYNIESNTNWIIIIN